VSEDILGGTSSLLAPLTSVGGAILFDPIIDRPQYQVLGEDSLVLKG